MFLNFSETGSKIVINSIINACNWMRVTFEEEENPERYYWYLLDGDEKFDYPCATDAASIPTIGLEVGLKSDKETCSEIYTVEKKTVSFFTNKIYFGFFLKRFLKSDNFDA